MRRLVALKSIYTPLLLLVVAAGPALSPEQTAPRGTSKIVVDDFEQDKAGATPAKWKFFNSKKRVFEPLTRHMSKTERFYVVEEGGNKFLRGFTNNEAQRISVSAEALGWDLAQHPRLQWRWRALHLPAKAREDEVNDTGGAFLVTFDEQDWLGRPHSIKYTYSSTLPVGKEISFGNLKVVVVASGQDGLGTWKKAERDVAADYRRLFGKQAPPPFALTLWSDSDDTRTVGEVDYDDIELLPAR